MNRLDSHGVTRANLARRICHQLETAEAAIGAGQGGDVSPIYEIPGGSKRVLFGPDHQGQKEKFMFRKSIGINIRGFVFKVGVLVEKLPPVTYLAMVDGPNEFAEETFDSADAALTWAQSRATWKTGIDGQTREIIIRWYQGEETGVLYRSFVEPLEVVVISRVL